MPPFRRVVPWLLLAATALFAFGPQLRSMLAGGKPSTAKATVGVLAVAAYGGYFNGGLGILLLALFGLLGQTQLNAMNGEELGLGPAHGHCRGHLRRRRRGAVAPGADDDGGRHRRRPTAARVAAHSRPWLRGGIVVTGLVMAGLFFWRQ